MKFYLVHISKYIFLCAARCCSIHVNTETTSYTEQHPYRLKLSQQLIHYKCNATNNADISKISTSNTDTEVIQRKT